MDESAINNSRNTIPPPVNNPWLQGSNDTNPNPLASMMGMPQPGVSPNQEQMNAAINMLENPMIQQMMEQALEQNPDMFRQMVVQQNPMMASMFANNFIRTMMNPEMLRNMMQMQQAFAGAAPSQPTGRTQSTDSPSNGLDFASLLQQMNNTGISPPSPIGAPFRMPL